MTKLKIAIVTFLLLASAPAFAQRSDASGTPSAHTQQDSGPYENMSRPE